MGKWTPPTAVFAIRQISLQDGSTAIDAAFVDHPHARGCAELGPVGSLLEPLRVIMHELIHRRSAVHHSVGKHRRLVCDRIPRLFVWNTTYANRRE